MGENLLALVILKILTFSPLLMVRSMERSTRSKPSRYLVLYASKVTTPLLGQWLRGLFSGSLCGASWITSWYYEILSTETRFVSMSERFLVSTCRVELMLRA